MLDKAREHALESALLLLYEAWARLPITPEHPRPYYAERFRQTIMPGCKRYKGGVQAVRDILGKREVDARRLKCYPDLTIEYLVSSGKWDDLFNETDRNLASLGLKKIQSLTTTSGGRHSQLPRNGLMARGATAARASRLGTRQPSDGVGDNGGNWEYTPRRLEAKSEI